MLTNPRESSIITIERERTKERTKESGTTKKQGLLGAVEILTTGESP